MSHYGDMYRAREHQAMIDAHLPDTYKNDPELSDWIKFKLAEGFKAREELRKLRAAAGAFKGLLS